MATDVLSSQAQLIQKYQSILNNNGLGSKLIKNVTINSPNLQGENFGSICKYVTLELHGESEKNIELFVKQVPTNSAHYEVLKDFDVFGKETAFFNILLPDLQKFYVEKSGNAKSMDFFPTCFYADSNEIIMKNLVKNYGYYLSPKAERQDLEHATKVIENLATLHAVSYSLVQEIGEEAALKKYGLCIKEILYTRDSSLIFDMIDNAKKIAVDLLNNNKVLGGDKALQALTKYGENISEKVVNLASRDSSTIFNVIGHGDCWNNNMMFLKDSETGSLKHHVLVDFQVMRYGSPNLDLTYYMFTSIKSEILKQHLKNLLQTYFKKFTSTVELLTSKSITTTFEEFLTDFKNKSLIGFWINVHFLTAVEAMANMDSTKMEGDLVTLFSTAITKWIRENPEKASNCTLDLVDFIEEYENILASY